MNYSQTAGEEADNIDKRLADELSTLTSRIVHIARAMPEDAVCRHIRDQMIRAGTAPGAHYAEARSAQSHADFTHKLSLAAKEARESLYWLRVVVKSDLVDENLQPTLDLADRLVGWLYSSLRTARRNSDRD